MLVDANLLLYSVDERGPFFAAAATWLAAQMNGSSRVALPWQSLTAFLRIATHPRASPNPLSPNVAWNVVQTWLASDIVWVPVPTSHHAAILGDLVTRYQLSGAIIQDAHLAALAIEHGLTVYSADTDFARFPEVRWENPIQP